jgi:RNA polymerase sigma factor (sigma-70 family)
LTSDTKSAFLAAVEKRHGHGLRRFLAARMRHAAPADVQDLAQEVFLRLLRIEDHESIRNARAYLYTIASHVLHQYSLRQTSNADTVELTDLALELHAFEDTDPAIQIEVEQRFEAIGRRLQQHSPRAYAALVMQRRDGIPLNDIAAKLGVSLSMTKRYLAQALAFLQQCLDETE